jgi:hypothetical protein
LRCQPDRSDPVTPADNAKSGNAFSTGTCPRRCNLDLDTNRILAWTAIASRIARLHTRPGPLRRARGARRRWSSRLRVGASVRRNGDSGQGHKFHERFHGDSPISAWLRPARNQALVALGVLYQGNRPRSRNLVPLTQVGSGLRAYRQAVLHPRPPLIQTWLSTLLSPTLQPQIMSAGCWIAPDSGTAASARKCGGSFPGFQ